MQCEAVYCFDRASVRFAIYPYDFDGPRILGELFRPTQGGNGSSGAELQQRIRIFVAGDWGNPIGRVGQMARRTEVRNGIGSNDPPVEAELRQRFPRCAHQADPASG